MNWTFVAKMEELLPRMPRVLLKDGLEIGIFRLSNNEVLAIENRCPHKNGPLSEGIVSDHYVFCSLHSQKINLKDGQVQKPDKGCVKTYPIELRGEEIWIGF